MAQPPARYLLPKSRPISKGWAAVSGWSGARADHFADDAWFEAVNRDLAFVLTFSSPGVKIDGTKGNDRVDGGGCDTDRERSGVPAAEPVGVRDD